MDGPPPQEEDFSSLPISERIAHKNWKARVSAYESLIKTFQTTASDADPAFKPYINNPDLLKKIATDSNAVAQEKGIECLVALVKFAGETAAKTRETVVPALVDKCFGSARAGTKSQAIELALQYIEVENSGVGVVADIIPGLSAKQPKAVAGTVLALKEIVKNFGTHVISPAPVLKTLPKIFAHTDKTVRAEGAQLTHILYQYIGPAIDPWLAELKPVQIKELQEAFEGLEKDGKGKGTLKADRMTREHAREAEVNQDAGVVPGDTEAEDLALPDPRTLAEPIDILSKLPSNFQTNLASSKWKERKEALDDLLTMVNATPRIKDASELGELAKSLATCIQKDANINCVMVAAGCIEGLAKGMMGSFARMREMVVPLMLERLKERKANVTDAIGAALDAVFSTTTLPDIIPDMLPALSNKNPQVKEGTLKFLGRSLSTSPVAVQPGQLKSLTDPLAILLEDGFEGARNEAATCLGTLMKMVGERPLNALMDGLADVRKAKVKEAYEKATVKAKAGAGGPPKPPPAASKEAPKKKPPAAKTPPNDASISKADPPGDLKIEDEPPKKSAAKPPARLMTKKPPAAAGAAASPATGGGPPAAAVKKPIPAAAAAAKPAKGGAPAPPGALDTFKYKHTPEDAEGLAAELIPGTIMTGLGDSNWKARLAACEEMTTWIENVVDDIEAEVVVRALAKKGWAEKNFQVSAKLYGILNFLAERCPSFGRSCVALSTGHLSEKLGDMKLKKPAGDALLAFSEKTSLQFVLNQAYEPLGKQKAPKVLADALVWVDSAILEFGIAGLSLRNLIDFLKNALKNSNAAVRTSATKTLVTVKLFAGSSIKDLLDDLNPQLLVTIQSEFDKVEGNPAPEPSRTSADVAAMAPVAGAGSSKGGLGDPLDDLYPRVEIDGLLKGTTILADAKSDAWKAKKEALETLQAILDQGANKRLKPAMGEIGQVLKSRVVDTNKAVQTLALDIVARIATGMGKPFEKQTKFFVVPVATALSDQKAPIRTAALHTLSAIASACEGIDSMVHFLTTALESTNPTQRATLLGWIADHFKDHPPSGTLDLSGWSGMIVSCLDDRSADVRKGAQAVLPTLITCVGFDRVMQQTNSLKPASRKTAVPLIQAARESAAPAAVEPPKAVPVASTVVDNPPSPSPPPAATPSHPGPASKLTGVRRKLPQGTGSRPDSRTESLEEAPVSRLASKPGTAGLKRPAVGGPGIRAPTSAALPVPAAATALPLSSMNLEAKRARLSKDAQRWVSEAGPTRKDLAEILQHQMEPHASKDLIALLFSHDHNAVNDHVSGLSTIYDFFSAAESGDDRFGVSPDDLRTVGLASFDLPLKYVSIKAHEPQSNLISRCLDVVEAVVAFLRSVDAHLEDSEAMCFVPTLVYKLGDAREPVRARVQHIIQSLPKVYAFSRVFDILLEYGLKSKVAKTRQGTLDELASLLKRNGMSACNQPSKAFPVVASMIADKDSQVRKSALSVLSEGYSLVGEKVWSLVGPLSPKDKTQLEERLRRVAGPSTPGNTHSPAPTPTPAPAPPAQVSRLAMPSARPGSPATLSKVGGGYRPASPAISVASRIARPTSPARTMRSSSPAPSNVVRPPSPARPSKLPGPSGVSAPSSIAAPSSPSGIGRPKTLLPSRLGPPRTHAKYTGISAISNTQPEADPEVPRTSIRANSHSAADSPAIPSADSMDDVETLVDAAPPYHNSDDITVTISSILSSDPLRSVDALKKIQKILVTKPEDGHLSPEYRELAEHTEGLIETITLQMAHVFDRPDDLIADENFRLAKHLIQTLNTFCDHALLAESLTVDILTPLLEELTMRLLETDESHVTKVKDLSRFINMIILRLFATGRRMSIFRALFALLLQIVKPFPSNGTLPESKEAKVAELVLKCVWKLARNIPQDLKEEKLDPVELLPAVEHFLQSVPPNEWRARATNKVPCGDMPLRTIKVIIQHVVAHYGDEVYDFLSASFDDPSATIVYPYVYRILNSSARAAEAAVRSTHSPPDPIGRPYSAASSRPISPQSSMASGNHRQSSPSHRTSPSVSSHNGNGFAPPVEEPDPEAQLLTIINHISSETTGAMHKEGITELHQFLKNYPHKRPRVEKLLESTGPAFRKYINRALASRAAEDMERTVAVASTLSKLESNGHDSVPSSPVARSEMSPRSPQHHGTEPPADDRLHKLHDLFQYKRASITSNGSSQGVGRSRVSEG